MEKSLSIQDILARESRLIRLPETGKAVFVGDTHGDFDATKTIFRLYCKPGYTLVFLGDYVDRGDSSLENIAFLLEKKAEAPDRIFLLAGNHEGYCSVPFAPADFWESLSPQQFAYFSEICKLFAFAAVSHNGIFAAHGVTPDLPSLGEINSVELCSDHWVQLTWGDFVEQSGDFIAERGGRPAYGEDYFVRTMQQLGMQVLIRSHQPNINPVIFQKRCLTLMTSYYYTLERRVAIVDLEKPLIRTVDDVEIVEIE
jgi:hypothetical protein